MRKRIGILVFGLAMGWGQQAVGATLSCDSCVDCTAKLQAAAAGDTVALTADLETTGGNACIDTGYASNVVFDGGGHVITRGEGGYTGVSTGAGSTGVTVTNIEVRGFTRGIYLISGTGHRLSECTVIGNSTGIELYSTSATTIEKSHIEQNFTGILIEYNSDGNIVRDSYLTRNHDAGITFFPRLDMGDPENNEIYNNVLKNTANGNVRITTISTEEQRDLSAIPFVFNRPPACNEGANIVGCGCRGGNYWELPSEQGFSQTCADTDQNGICDESYTLPHATALMVDAYPLSVPAAGCCADTDRDQDGFANAICGGDDPDDDPLSCGAACRPGGVEICDGYDNDGDGQADGTIACQDKLLDREAWLPRVTAHQSCAEDPATHRIFCFGGGSYGGPWYLDTITAYDPATDTLEQLPATLPSPRESLTCSFAPSTGKIYCFGGYSQETICLQWEEWGCVAVAIIPGPSDEILEFDPENESLTTLPAVLPAALDGASSAWSSQTDSLFVFGGTSSVHSGDRDFILEFEPLSATLTQKAARLPSARYNHSCTENSQTGKIYCFGGFGPGPEYGLNQIVEYDPENDAARVMNTVFPTDIYNTSCVEDSVDHLIYCLGGRGKATSPNYTNLIYAYDPASDTLEEKTARYLFERYGHACAENSATNKIYCFGGGRNVIALSEISEYTPALPPFGDVNDSGQVDLADLVESLQVSSDLDRPGLNRKADIGGNRQIGLEESVYILQKNAGQ